MSERIITYTQLCPECAKAGAVNHILYSVANGTFFCEAPEAHPFATLPEEAAPEVKVETAPGPENVRVDVVDEEGFVAKAFREAKEKRAQAEAEAPAEVAAWQISEVADLNEPEAVTVAAEAAADRNPTFAMDLVSTVLSVCQGEIADLPGGDKLIGLRIKEQWVSAIAAEAEVQHLTFADYLDYWLNDWAMTQEWSPAPSAR